MVAVKTEEQISIAKVDPIALINKNLWRSKPAYVSALVLAIFYLSAAFADFLAPYSMGFADPDLANAPPTKIHFIVDRGIISGPFVYLVERIFDIDAYKQIIAKRKYPDFL